jgi:hypothetical protein
MKNRPSKSVIAILLAPLLLLASMTVTATTLVELLQADKVRINTWIEPAEGIVARQQVNLQIEVATDKWFSGGTRIGHFEIEDAIVLQREQFALNSTRRDGDITWTVQQWTLVVYPQRSGSFEIPAIPLTLSIAGENLEVIRGETRTQAMTFSAELPAALQGEQDWVATTDFEVNDSFDKSPELLKPGDALIRSISMSASNLPAMMLPKAMTADIPGIAVYAKPARLIDKVNRGEYLAERTQVITYVFERPGEFQLPAETYHWWNLETRSAEMVTLPAQTIVVAGLPGQPADQRNASQADLYQELKDNLPMIILAGLIVVLMFAALWIARRWVRHNQSSTSTTASKSWLLKQAKQACRKNNQQQALDYLYQWLGHYGNNAGSAISEQVDKLNNDELRLSYDEMMQAIYSSDKSRSGVTCRFIDQFTTAIKKQNRPNYTVQWTVEMKLN